MFKRIPLFILLFLFAHVAPATSYTDYYENKTVDLIRGTSYTPPATWYVSLHTTSSTDSTPGTEVSGGAYARASISADQTDWYSTQGTTGVASSGTDGTIENATAITFPAPSGANWGSVVGFCIFDASSGGNAIICEDLTTPKTINDGDAAPSFAISALSIQGDN